MTTKSDFKTHEKKHKRVCGSCVERGRASGWCIYEGAEVKQSDPADGCKHYNEGKAS